MSFRVETLSDEFVKAKSAREREAVAVVVVLAVDAVAVGRPFAAVLYP